MDKISPEEKIQWMKKILQKKESISSVASKIGVYYTTVDKWLRNYKAIGPEAFFRKGHTYRTPAQKEAAVFDYLSGKGSLRDICARHKISDAQILRRWIMKYNSHDKETGGRPIMTKGRKTTFEERVEIVQYCIKHSHNYSETAKKFHISYQQARSYTIRYEENGVDGLQDKRGKRKSPEEMTEVEKLRAEVRLLRAEKRRAEIEISFLKKLEEIERRGRLSLIRQEHIYRAIKKEHEKYNYPILLLCEIGGIARSSYYKWLHHAETPNERFNEELAEKLERLHEKHPDMGYRRLNDKLRHDEDIQVNDKRILRICRKKQIRSNLKSRYNGCTRASNNPAFIAENILNREFKAEHLNEKWVTDVTELKYGNTLDSVHKVYLSAILDLCDRRPVAYVIGDSNNNALVFETFDKAVKANPGAHPIFHSDRGYQYTSRRFHQKLEEAGMVQSMSRVAHCTDNGVMEGFWGILKREMYYGKKFESREELEKAITEYIDYYTNDRPQRGLGVLTPMEFHEKQRLAA